MAFLSLDLGTKTGFVVFDVHEDGTVYVKESGTKNLKQLKNSHIGLRFAVYYQWLSELLKKHDIKHVYFEQVYGHTGVQAAHVYGGFLYVLALICANNQIGMTGIAPTTIKKVATGKGNANKSEVIEAVSQYGFKPIDDNEADALALMMCTGALFYDM